MAGDALIVKKEEIIENFLTEINNKSLTNKESFDLVKRIYKFAKENNLLNLALIYDALNKDAKRMDLEFLKTLIQNLGKDSYKTPIRIFDTYWEQNRGPSIPGGIPIEYKIELNNREVFIPLLLNNSIEDTVIILRLIYSRLKSLHYTF